MVSDLGGKAGTAELVAFARRIGLRPEWIQERGTPREHFDLVASRRSKALALGALETTTKQLAERAFGRAATPTAEEVGRG